MAGKFKLGSRYIIQADIYYKGKGVAFGYAIPGGLSQYVVIGPEVLEGDEGCYLLPVKEETGFAEAALVEPWTCVIASYQIKARTSLRENGHMRFSGFARGQIPLDLKGLETAKVRHISHSGLSAENARAVEELAHRTGAAIVPAGAAAPAPTDQVIAGTPDKEAFARIVNEMDADSVLGVHTSEPNVICPSTWERSTTGSSSWWAPWTGRSPRAIAPTTVRAWCRAAAPGSSAVPAPWARCTSSRRSWTRRGRRRSS